MQLWLDRAAVVGVYVGAMITRSREWGHARDDYWTRNQNPRICSRGKHPWFVKARHRAAAPAVLSLMTTVSFGMELREQLHVCLSWGFCLKVWFVKKSNIPSSFWLILYQATRIATSEKKPLGVPTTSIFSDYGTSILSFEAASYFVSISMSDISDYDTEELHDLHRKNSPGTETETTAKHSPRIIAAKHSETLPDSESIQRHVKEGLLKPTRKTIDPNRIDIFVPETFLHVQNASKDPLTQSSRQNDTSDLTENATLDKPQLVADSPTHVYYTPGNCDMMSIADSVSSPMSIDSPLLADSTFKYPIEMRASEHWLVDQCM